MEKSVDWQFDSYMQEIFQMKEVHLLLWLISETAFLTL